jgi:hypothetical protein
MAKRLSRVAMVKETGDVGAVDKTKARFFKATTGVWRNQLRQMLAGAPKRLARRSWALPRGKLKALAGSCRQPDKI